MLYSLSDIEHFLPFLSSNYSKFIPNLKYLKNLICLVGQYAFLSIFFSNVIFNPM